MRAPKSQDTTLPSAFYFTVSIAECGSDSAFQEVSGIGSTMETEKIYEGGENRFVHNLPKGVTHSPLELKRGIAPLNSPLVKWCKSVMEGEFSMSIEPKAVSVHLMDHSGVKIRSWVFVNAFPTKWEVVSFGAEKSEVAIEKISLTYTYSKRFQ